ncbi:MAG: alpha/beta hydrolase [Rickettsiales bacterium]
MVDYTERSFRASDLSGLGTHRLSYLDWNEASPGIPVLCMHGLTRNSHDFDYIAKALSYEHRVIAVDTAGRGKSEWLANKLDYHYGTYLADAMALLDELHINEVIWIGTSMGGILGMMAAGMYPERIKALVLNDVGKLVPKEGLQRISTYAGKAHTFKTKQEAESYLKDIFRTFGISNEQQWAHLIQYSLMETPEGYSFACDPDILLPLAHQTDWFKLMQDVDLSLIWQAVQCPVLLLRGKDSDILREDTAKEMAEDKGKNVTLIEFQGVGHAPALLDDGQISAVVDWLKKQ